MKKFLLALFLVGMSPVLPANANTAATDCFNSLIEHPDDTPDSATLTSTISHEGSQYHVIEEKYNGPRQPMVRNYIRTDAQGGCEELLTYQLGSHPEVEVYNQRLGPEVFEKLKQAYRDRKAQESRR